MTRQEYLDKISQADDVTIKKNTEREYDVRYDFISRKFYVVEHIATYHKQIAGKSYVGNLITHWGYYYDENGKEIDVHFGANVGVEHIISLHRLLEEPVVFRTLDDAFNMLQYLKTLKDIDTETFSVT